MGKKADDKLAQQLRLVRQLTKPPPEPWQNPVLSPEQAAALRKRWAKQREEADRQKKAGHILDQAAAIRDGLIPPPWAEKQQSKTKRGAPFKLTPDEAKRGIDMICDEKKNDPRLTMDAAEAMLKERLKHDGGSSITISRELWRQRVIRPAFEQAAKERRK
jgi:hypothetical protein